MIITAAIRGAQTEEAVFFLLSAYIETLGCSESYGIPGKVKRLPVRSRTAVRKRLGVMRKILHSPMKCPATWHILEEAADVLAAVFERLGELHARSRLPHKPRALLPDVKSTRRGGCSVRRPRHVLYDPV